MKTLKAVVALAVFATLCVAQGHPACGAGQGCLTEVPSGAIDGKNCRFTLSRVPNPRTSIQVYRNGVRLEPGEDYEASANTITFTNREAPVPGDSLEAVYEPAARQLQPDRSAAPVSGTAGEEISSGLARQALSTELMRLSAPEPSTGQTDATSPASSADTDPISPPSRSAAVHPKKGKRKSQKSKNGISAQGVDGLGDNSLESDSTDVENSDSASTKGGFHSALQLLERRLNPQRSAPDSDKTPQQAVNSSK
ncbi:MAG TPA: hypothetical protein VFB14_18530 [Bryobacteraceae bacterium]|nr:hypothetical protein [Bryobacteraceae bacterium]